MGAKGRNTYYLFLSPIDLSGPIEINFPSCTCVKAQQILKGTPPCGVRRRQEVRSRTQVPEVRWHLDETGQNPYDSGHLCSGQNQSRGQKDRSSAKGAPFTTQERREHRLQCRPTPGGIMLSCYSGF